jgi:hypothetical protein
MDADLVREIREFAATLPDDLGPMFGRDVAQLAAEWEALKQIAEAADHRQQAKPGSHEEFVAHGALNAALEKMGA